MQRRGSARNGILYTRIGTISKYYFREGQFENGKLISGFLSNYYGTFPVIGGTTSTGYRKEFQNRFILTVRIDFEIRVFASFETQEVSRSGTN